MWPDLRPTRTTQSRGNPFIPPGNVPDLQVTIDHRLEAALPWDEEYQFFRELLALDYFTPVRKAGTFEGLGGLEFDYGPLEGYPDNLDETCLVTNPGGGVSQVWLPRTAWDLELAAGRDLPSRSSGEAAEIRSFILAALSTELGSHMLVSGSVYLRPPGVYFRCNPCVVQEALAVFGLHMRTHGRVVLANEPARFSVERSTAENLEAARLLPTLHGFSMDGPTDRSLAGLAGACVERMTRLLRARDHVMVAETMAGPSHWVDPCVDTEAAAVAFTAGLDAFARLVRDTLKWDLHDSACGLHRKSFSRKLMSSLDSDDQRAALGRATLLAGLVAKLRNTLHAEPLGRAYYRSDGLAQSAVVRVQRDVADHVVGSAVQLGQADRWFRATDDGSYLLNPFSLVNDLARALPAILESMAVWLFQDHLDVASSSRPRNPLSSVNMDRNARLYGLWLWSVDPTALSIDGTVHRGHDLLRTAPPTPEGKGTK